MTLKQFCNICLIFFDWIKYENFICPYCGSHLISKNETKKMKGGQK